MTGCAQCARAAGGVCKLHRARTPDEIVEATCELLRTRAGAGLAALLDSSFQALIDSMPDEVMDEIERIREKTINDAWHRLMNKEQFTVSDLRALAAASLARVIYYEATHREEEEDTDDGDEEEADRARGG